MLSMVKLSEMHLKTEAMGDYAPFIVFEKEDVLDMQSDMIDFIEKINSFLSNLKDETPHP
jgi:hypothetical protein